ncbi:MAG: ATP-binding protein [Thermodesulfobacteriota bacterium]
MNGNKKISLRLKLTLGMWLVMLLFIIVPVYFIFNSLEDEVRQEAIHRAELVGSSLSMALRARFESDPRTDMPGFVEQAGKKLGMRVTFVDHNGVVRADSEVPPARLDELDNHIRRPEIRAALRSGEGSSVRYSRTVQNELLYHARKIGGESLPEGYLRISMPYSRVQNALDRMSSDIWAIAAACFGASALIIFLLVRQVTRAIFELSATAEAIGQGDYSRRIRNVPAPEFQPLAKAINDMAEEVGNSLQLISGQKVELEVTLNSMKDGVLALDNEGRIQNCNNYFRSMFSVDSACIGKRPLEIIMHAELQSVCNEALKSERNKNFDLTARIEDRFFDVNVVATPETRYIGAIVVFHDITELKRVENMRKDFVSNASHELRTPLTSIKGYTETLLENEKARRDQGKEMLEVIHKNANSMMSLLDDILQLSRIESDREILNIDIVDMQQVVKNAWNDCHTLHTEKDIQFETESDQSCLKGMGDAQGLARVMRNLFENSIKYVPDSGGRIVLRCLDKEKEVWIGVQDNGPGIPRHLQERVFERFYRVEKHRNSSTKGTGLGLSICRNLLQKMNGRIWIESPLPDADNGTIVWITLLKPEETNNP